MSDGKHDDSGRNLPIAFFLNLAFVVIEAVGGLWTNSIAIVSDALHDLGDCITLGAAWYFERLSRRRADVTFTYGYRRFSVLGALLTGSVLLVGLLFVVWKAVARLWNPEPVYAPGMIGIAVVGIVFNGAAVLRVRRGRSQSMNETAISWHLLEDVLGCVAMLIWDLPIIDPLLSIGVSLFVLWNVIKNLRKVAMVFLQTAPKSFDRAQFSTALGAVEKVLSSHHTHTWSIDGSQHVLSTHLVMAADASRDEVVAVKRRINDILRDHRFEHITIDVELEGEDCAATHRPPLGGGAAARGTGWQGIP